MKIYVEGHPDTHWMAHVLEEPGCIWIASDQDKLLAGGPQAVALYKNWLELNGEPRLNIIQDLKLEIAEVKEIPRLGISGTTVALFTPDFNPIYKEEIATVIRRLGYARRELLELVTLHQKTMDWPPPNGKRTLRQNLEHIRDCQGYYLSRLLGKDNLESRFSGPWPQDTLESLHWMHENAARILFEWPPTLYGGVYKAEKPLEDWTPRKMLRRILEHELEHIWVIRRTIFYKDR